MLVRDRNGAYATLEGLHDRAAAKLAGRVGGDGSFCPKVAWCALQPGPSILLRPDSFRAEPARPKREAEGVTQDVNDGTASFRLSPQQEHLWRSYPSGPVLAVHCLIDVGEAASDAVQTALGLVVERHEILRTTFVRRQGLKLPNQVINERLDIAWQDADAAGHADQVGDLGRGPVLRAGFLVETGGNRLLALTIPAVCADARSLIVLASELRAELAKPAGPWPEPLQYADYAEWRSESVATDASAWVLEALPASPKLPFVWNEDLQPATAPQRVPVPLDRAAVARGAGACRVTEAVFVEACWHACLARLSGDGAVLVGAVVEGRAHEELADAVGPYAQALPLLTTVDENTSIAELVDQIRRQRVRLEQQQNTADGSVLEQVAQRCRIGFSATELPRESGVTELIGGPAPFLAHLCWLGAGEAWHAELQVSPRLVESGTAALLSETLTAVIASAASDVTAMVADQAVLSGAPAKHKLAALTGPAAPPAVTITELFEAVAAKAKDSVALVAPDATLTYGELNTRANQVAHRLRELGVGRHANVALCMERSANSIVALLGVLKAGAAYVPLNFEHPPARLAHQLAETEAPVLLTETSLSDRLPDFNGFVLHIDGEAALLDALPAGAPERENEPEDVVYVMYTSGSTGTPKGVAVTHRNLATYASAILQRLELEDTPGVGFAAVSALSTDLGNTSIFASLLGGGALHLVSPADSMDGARFAAYLSSNTVDVLKITPSHLRALLAATDSELVLPKRWLVLGGEALAWDLVEQIQAAEPSCRILNHYGPTETTVGTCTFEVGTAPQMSSTVPIGRPLSGSRTYVIDRNLELLPIGVPGELCIGGLGVARGYLAQPGQTNERFLADPFAQDGSSRIYRTGDRVRALPGGDLEFLGRVDDQVKIHGFRVEPAEVQIVLATHAAVRQCAVVARVESDGDAELVAYVVCSSKVSAEELRAFLRESLPAYMVPAKVVELEALPFTASGKIDRRALPEPASLESVVEYVAPRTALELELAQIWSELLGIERVGVNDDFFALGGHSLLATQAVIRIRNAIADIPLHSLFNAPTVSALAEAIVDAELEATDAGTAASTHGP